MPLILNTLGPPPNPLSPQIYEWERNLIAFANQRCPRQRATTVYIKQDALGNSTGGSGNGSIGTPFLCNTSNDLATFIMANQAQNKLFLLRCGDIWYTNTTTPIGVGALPTVPNQSIGSYVDPAQTNYRIRFRPPEPTGYSAPVTGGWTAVGGGPWYYRDYLANGSNRPRGIRFSDGDTNRGSYSTRFRFHDKSTGGPFTSAADAELVALLADTTAENVYTLLWVSATTYRIYVKLATGDPNTNTSLEVLQGTGPIIGVGNVDGCRIFGVRATGCGALSDSGTPGTQTPPILVQNAGETMSVIEGGEAFDSGTHAIEQYTASSGGTIVMLNCVAGYVSGNKNTTATVYEGFAPATGTPGDGSGRNEMVCINCRVSHGCLSVYSFSVAAGGPNFWSAFYNHTGNFANPPALTYFSRCSVDPNPPGVGIYELGGGDIVAPTDVKNPATYRGIMIDCVLGSSLSANWRSPNRFVMVNCKAHLVRWGTSDAANGLNQNTYTSSGDFYTVAANCEVFVDATSLSPSASNTFPTFYAASPSSRYDLYFSHCRFIFRMADKNIALSFVNQNQVSTSTGHGNSILHNCEFYALTIGESGILGADPLKNTTTLGFLNQAATATQGGFIGCAFHNFQAINTTAGVLGYNNSTYYDASNTPGFTSFLGFGIAHPALAGKGRPHPIPALAPTMDANGYPRPAGDYTLGPVLSPLTIRPTRAVPSYAPRT